ncbi:MAG TPA: hypothetical protein EYN67_01690 [Flavobacteriales bacterium]|nr:hypothetical protein [Flavobacteriales bacterium]
MSRKRNSTSEPAVKREIGTVSFFRRPNPSLGETELGIVIEFNEAIKGDDRQHSVFEMLADYCDPNGAVKNVRVYGNEEQLYLCGVFPFDADDLVRR